jgi:hypothetical protein
MHKVWVLGFEGLGSFPMHKGLTLFHGVCSVSCACSAWSDAPMAEFDIQGLMALMTRLQQLARMLLPCI